jgi:hypothetical protein
MSLLKKLASVMKRLIVGPLGVTQSRLLLYALFPTNQVTTLCTIPNKSRYYMHHSQQTRLLIYALFPTARYYMHHSQQINPIMGASAIDPLFSGPVGTIFSLAHIRVLLPAVPVCLPRHMLKGELALMPALLHARRERPLNA